MTENRTKKLVAPGITEGEWLLNTFDGKKFSIVVESDTSAAPMIADRVDEANARFLSGSKRVAEAAAKFISSHPERVGEEITPEAIGRWMKESEAAEAELRAALLASGYTEQVHD